MQPQIIEWLKELKADDLRDYHSMSSQKQEELLKSLAEYFEAKPSALNEFSSLKPKEFSSLSIVYEALSMYSTKFFSFLHDEVVRIVNLAKNGEIKSKRIEVLQNIDADGMHDEAFEDYERVIAFLIQSVSNQHRIAFNLAVLELLDDYLLMADVDPKQLQKWEGEIVELSKDSYPKVRKHIEKNFSMSETDDSKVEMGRLWQGLFLAGLIAQIFAIGYFRRTLIDIELSLMIYTASGILGCAIFYKPIKRNVKFFIYQLVFSIVSFGGLISLGFLAMNFQFASSKIVAREYRIVQKSSLPGSKSERSKRKPVVHIRIYGENKEVIFPYEMTEEVEKSNILMIQTSEGAFGFDIIRSRELK